MSELEVVFRWHAPPGEDESRMPIVPPMVDGARYLSSLEILAGGQGIVRMPFQLHGYDIRGYHTMCGQNARITLKCDWCTFLVTAFSPGDGLSFISTHYDTAHPGERHKFELVELEPVNPYTKQVES